MQAVTIKRFVIGHRVWTLLVVGLVIGSIIGVSAIALTRETAVGGGEPDAAQQAAALQLRMDRADWIDFLRVTVPLSDQDEGLDRADQLARFYEAKLANQDALEAQASNRDNWTAFPGHAGFINPSTSRLDRTDQMERFWQRKEETLDTVP